MKKFKLVKEYPLSPKLGFIVCEVNDNHWKCDEYPEYWEEVIEKDYQILSFMYGSIEPPMVSYSVTSDENLFQPSGLCVQHTEEQILNEGHKIHSIKRLSDGEIFTVGDMITGYHKDARIIQKIRICTYTGRIRLEQSGGYTDFSHATKVKQPIFLTHDGKDIFAGDKVWFVKKDSLSYDFFQVCLGTKFYSDINTYFLTQDDAREYISKNKILFTTEDGVDVREGDKIWYTNKDLSYRGKFIVSKFGFFDYSNVYFTSKQSMKNYIEKSEVLFQTQDGIDVKKWDIIYIVGDDVKKPIGLKVDEWRPESTSKYVCFSNKKMAKEYIIRNAKLLSVEDVMSLFTISPFKYDNLCDLVESRI